MTIRILPNGTTEFDTVSEAIEYQAELNGIATASDYQIDSITATRQRVTPPGAIPAGDESDIVKQFQATEVAKGIGMYDFSTQGTLDLEDEDAEDAAESVAETEKLTKKQMRSVINRPTIEEARIQIPANLSERQAATYRFLRVNAHLTGGVATHAIQDRFNLGTPSAGTSRAKALVAMGWAKQGSKGRGHWVAIPFLPRPMYHAE